MSEARAVLLASAPGRGPRRSGVLNACCGDQIGVEWFRALPSPALPSAQLCASRLRSSARRLRLDHLPLAPLPLEDDEEAEDHDPAAHTDPAAASRRELPAVASISLMIYRGEETTIPAVRAEFLKICKAGALQAAHQAAHQRASGRGGGGDDDDDDDSDDESDADLPLATVSSIPGSSVSLPDGYRWLAQHICPRVAASRPFVAFMLVAKLEDGRVVPLPVAVVQHAYYLRRKLKAGSATAAEEAHLREPMGVISVATKYSLAFETCASSPHAPPPPTKLAERELVGTLHVVDRLQDRELLTASDRDTAGRREHLLGRRSNVIVRSFPYIPANPAPHGVGPLQCVADSMIAGFSWVEPDKAIATAARLRHSKEATERMRQDPITAAAKRPYTQAASLVPPTDWSHTNTWHFNSKLTLSFKFATHSFSDRLRGLPSPATGPTSAMASSVFRIEIRAVNDWVQPWLSEPFEVLTKAHITKRKKAGTISPFAPRTADEARAPGELEWHVNGTDGDDELERNGWRDDTPMVDLHLAAGVEAVREMAYTLNQQHQHQQPHQQHRSPGSRPARSPGSRPTPSSCSRPTPSPCSRPVSTTSWQPAQAAPTAPMVTLAQPTYYPDQQDPQQMAFPFVSQYFDPASIANTAAAIAAATAAASAAAAAAAAAATSASASAASATTPQDMQPSQHQQPLQPIAGMTPITRGMTPITRGMTPITRGMTPFDTSSSSAEQFLPFPTSEQFLQPLPAQLQQQHHHHHHHHQPRGTTGMTPFGSELPPLPNIPGPLSELGDATSHNLLDGIFGPDGGDDTHDDTHSIAMTDATRMPFPMSPSGRSQISLNGPPPIGLGYSGHRRRTRHDLIDQSGLMRRLAAGMGPQLAQLGDDNIAAPTAPGTSAPGTSAPAGPALPPVPVVSTFAPSPAVCADPYSGMMAPMLANTASIQPQPTSPAPTTPAADADAAHVPPPAPADEPPAVTTPIQSTARPLSPAPAAPSPSAASPPATASPSAPTSPPATASPAPLAVSSEQVMIEEPVPIDAFLQRKLALLLTGTAGQGALTKITTPQTNGTVLLRWTPMTDATTCVSPPGAADAVTTTIRICTAAPALPPISSATPALPISSTTPRHSKPIRKQCPTSLPVSVIEPVLGCLIASTMDTTAGTMTEAAAKCHRIHERRAQQQHEINRASKHNMRAVTPLCPAATPSMDEDNGVRISGLSTRPYVQQLHSSPARPTYKRPRATSEDDREREQEEQEDRDEQRRHPETHPIRAGISQLMTLADSTKRARRMIDQRHRRGPASILLSQSRIQPQFRSSAFPRPGSTR